MDRRRKYMIKKYILTYFKIILGTTIMAIGISQFLLPNKLSTGGFSGLATIGHYLFNMPMGLLVIMLNIPVFIISYFRVGKGFFVKSLVGTITLSMGLNFFEELPALTNDKFLSCIYGGILVGLGTALALSSKASTGGSDLVANIIRTYKPELKTGSLIVIVDIIIVGLNILFFKEIEIGLYSALAIYIMGKIIDIVFEGIDFTKQIFIISTKHQKISDKINTEIKRGTTGLYGKGMYKNEEVTVLLCVAGRSEIMKIIHLVKRIDPHAFIIVSNAREVIGQGFKQ